MSAPAATLFYLDPEDDASDLVEFLVHFSALVDHAPLAIQVYDHPNGDCVMVVGPHLTDTLVQTELHEWVDAWWSDGDEQQYGTPAAYLSQLTRRLDRP